ncbi:MAG: hypothetical protein ACTSRZ_12550 [Promethearchaeota archaeon]
MLSIIFQNSEFPENTIRLLKIGYYNTVQIILWVVFAVIATIFATRLTTTYVEEGKGKGEIGEKTSIALTLFLLGLSRIMFIFAYKIEVYYELFNSIGYFIMCISMIPVVWGLESWKLFNTKRVFSILEIILAAYCGVMTTIYFFEIDLPIFSSLILLHILAILSVLIPLILFISAYKNAIGVDKREFSLMIAGYIILLLGTILTNESLLFELYGNPLLRFLFYADPVFFIASAILSSKLITLKTVRI